MYKIVIIAIVFSFINISTIGVAAVCETNEVKTRTREDGSTYVGISDSSGYVDENGCPLTQDDYDELVKNENKSMQTRLIIISAGILVVVSGLLLYRKTKSLK